MSVSVAACLLLLGVDMIVCQYKVQRQDPFALLSATLQTYQEAACDSQALSLVCPAGTKISIQLVQYGRAAPSHQVSPGSQSTSTQESRPKYTFSQFFTWKIV